MTDSEVTVEINAQKAAFDEYLKWIQAVRAAESDYRSKREVLDVSGAHRSNACARLAQLMKENNISVESVEKYIDEGSLYHVRKEMSGR